MSNLVPRFGAVVTKRLGATLLSLVAAILLTGVGSASATSFLPAGSFGSFTNDSGSGQFGSIAPVGVGVDQSTGDVYVSDTVDGRVEKFDQAGDFLSQFGSSGSGSGQLGLVFGVAVDSSTGAVYVADLSNSRVEKFDSQGNFVLMVGGGVDQTTGGNVCTASSHDTCGSGAPGGGDGQFASGFSWLGNQIAVDPSTGDVYVADTSNGRVEKFDPNGNYLSQITTNLSGPVSVAVDPTGNVYVADTGAGAVEKYDSSGTFLGAIGAGTGPSAVATDASGDLFAFESSPSTQVVEYDPTGTQIGSLGSGTVSSSGFNSGIAYGDALGVLYIDQPNTSNVLIYGAVLAPSVDATYSTAVSSDTATLGAQLDPHGAATTYHFEYGTTTAYGSSSPESTLAGSDFTDHPALATVSGLSPSTIYHYRVVATNSLGTAGGPDHTFTTFPVAGPRALPDSRGYELVSPADKNNHDVSWQYGVSITPNGDAVGFTSLWGFADAQTNVPENEYVASRGPDGWSTVAISPPHPPSNCAYNFQPLGFSADLSRAVFSNAPAGTLNLYLRDPDGSLQLLTPNTPAGDCSLQVFGGGSADLSHIVVSRFVGNSEAQVYEWVNGSITPLPGSGAGSASIPLGGAGSLTNAVSTDGSRVYTSSGAVSEIDLTEGGTSTPITASQCTGSPSCDTGNGFGTYWTASTDGSSAFFTSVLRLSDDSTASRRGAGTPQGDLYQYYCPLGAQCEGAGQLTDLTVDSTDPGGADVQGVVDASDDGSYVYFVADGVLASGAAAGQPNLYLAHGGSTQFIATLSSSDSADWGLTNPPTKTSRAQVSADGRHLLFTSVASLTGYDNAGHPEVYLYDAASGSVTCVSCNPSGAIATGDAFLGFAVTGQQAMDTAQENNLSGDGERVFFETTDALLPKDTDGVSDVYEWEADGKGSCQSSFAEGGCLYLISNGQSSSGSYFVNSTPSGDDVFFATRDQLVGQDTDQNLDIYDARVGGGFPGPAAEPVPCSGEDCQGPPAAAPLPPTVATVSFQGPGNPRSGVARVRVLSRVVHGSVFVLRVAVPGPGRVWISGHGVTRASRYFTHAGTESVRVSLTRAARRLLARRHRLRLTVLVRYGPVGGAASTAKVHVVVTPTGRHGHSRGTRGALRHGGRR